MLTELKLHLSDDTSDVKTGLKVSLYTVEEKLIAQ